MTSTLLKVSIMTQMDISFCILLFYIFLRNVMVFDKELAIFYGFFNLRISKKTSPLDKSPNGAQNFLISISFYIKMHIILYKTAKFRVLNKSKSTLLVPPLIIKKFGHYLVFLKTLSPSHVT